MRVWEFLLFVVAAGSFVHHPVGLEDLPGWLGEIESVRPRTKPSTYTYFRKRKRETLTVDPTKVVQLSWRPRIFLYEGFLSEEECDHLISLARSNLEKSRVTSTDTGEARFSTVRTSSSMFLRKGQDEVTKGIEDRIATWTFLPPENGESLQILRYEHGEKYEPHLDYYYDKPFNSASREPGAPKFFVEGGDRVATVLMYLSTVIRGGETIFPNSTIKESTWPDCARKGLAVKPTKGDALLFFNLHPEASPDSMSLHGSCPVIQGEKWAATKWIHMSTFGYGRSVKASAM